MAIRSPLYRILERAACAVALAAAALACGAAPAAPEASPSPAPPPPAAPPPAASSPPEPAPPAPEPAPPASAAAAEPAPAASGPALAATLRVKNPANGEYPYTFVHAPRPLRHLGPTPVVVYLHGWNGCLKVLIGSENAPCRDRQPTRYAMDLVAQFDRAQVDALLVVPQLAFDQASSAPLALAKPGHLAAMLKEILARAEVAPFVPETPSLGRVVLIGHSGAYLPLGRALGRGGVDVHEVWLFDSYYLDVPELKPWFEAHRADFSPGHRRRLAFVYTEGEKTGPRTLELLGKLVKQLPEEARSEALWRGNEAEVASDEALSHPLVAQQTGIRHEQIPPRFLVPLLRTAGLPVR